MHLARGVRPAPGRLLAQGVPDGHRDGIGVLFASRPRLGPAGIAGDKGYSDPLMHRGYVVMVSKCSSPNVLTNASETGRPLAFDEETCRQRRVIEDRA